MFNNFIERIKNVYFYKGDDKSIKDSLSASRKILQKKEDEIIEILANSLKEKRQLYNDLNENFSHKTNVMIAVQSVLLSLFSGSLIYFIDNKQFDSYSDVNFILIYVSIIVVLLIFFIILFSLRVKKEHRSIDMMTCVKFAEKLKPNNLRLAILFEEIYYEEMNMKNLDDRKYIFSKTLGITIFAILFYLFGAILSIKLPNTSPSFKITNEKIIIDLEDNLNKKIDKQYDLFSEYIEVTSKHNKYIDHLLKQGSDQNNEKNIVVDNK